MLPNDDMDGLRLKLTHAEAVIVELRGVVAELRKQIDSQQAHIHRLVKITFGQSTSERLDYQPMAIFIRELVRPTYSCRSCFQQGRDPQIAKAVLPPEPIPKSGIGAGLLAHVIVSKFVDHLPLHRQESILARHGWEVRRSTLCDHLQKCGQLLTPLYDAMHRRLLLSFAIHADDSPLVLLRPRRTAYAWVYIGDVHNPYTLFDLTAGRRQEFPQAFFAGYRGFVHADAYDGSKKRGQDSLDYLGVLSPFFRLLDACPSILRGGGAERSAGGRSFGLHSHPLRRGA